MGNRPNIRRKPLKGPKPNKVRHKYHSGDALSYELYRARPAGRASSLKKTRKLYQMGGAHPPEDLARHKHPARFRD